MKKIILIGLVLLSYCLLYSQHEHHDEILVDKALVEEIRVITEKATQFIQTDLDSALFYVRQGFQMASSANDHRGIFENMLLLGNGFLKVGEYEEALVLYKETENLLKDLPPIDKLRVTKRIGLAYTGLKKYDTALANYQLVLDSLDMEPHQELYGVTLVGIGHIYRMQQLDSLALATQLQALPITEKENLSKAELECLMEIGLIYEQKGMLKRAIGYFEQALAKPFIETFPTQKVNGLNLLSRVYQKSMNPHKSIINAELSLDLAEQKKDYKNASVACENLVKCFQLLNQQEDARKYQLLANSYTQKSLREERNKISTILKTSFELSKKELENHVLRESEVSLKEGIRQNRVIIVLICTALIFATLLAGLFLYFNKTKQKTNHLLKQQNEEINLQKEDLEKAMSQLKIAQKQLLQSEKMASVGLLTAGIAHEINNPLNFVATGVNGLEKNLNALLLVATKYDKIENKENFDAINQEIQTLKTKIDYEEVVADIKGLMVSIKDGAERTGAIVAGLKTFSRTDYKDLTTNDIHQNMEDTLVLLNSQLKDKITINKQYDPNLSKIESHSGQLNQVFMNILTNATQAILPEKGMITIVTKELKNTIEIQIADTGSGMSEATQKRIFEPFFTTKEIGEGTGLGLSISYGIIEQHQGKITVESEESKGTTFTIRLPKEQGNEIVA